MWMPVSGRINGHLCHNQHACGPVPIIEMKSQVGIRSKVTKSGAEKETGLE